MQTSLIQMQSHVVQNIVGYFIALGTSWYMIPFYQTCFMVKSVYQKIFKCSTHFFLIFETNVQTLFM